MASSAGVPLVLASQSPRRRQLLETLGLAFRIEKPESDEIMPEGEGIEHVMEANALAKALSVVARRRLSDEIIIGADTLVVLDGEALGKPKDKRAVIQTLRKLSGRTHEVLTGLALVSDSFGQHTSVHRSQVTFHELAPTEIEAYSEILEPYDKAGSYAVQGAGTLFIANIEGSYTNVMGLPIEGFLRELTKMTGRPVFDFFPGRSD